MRTEPAPGTFAVREATADDVQSVVACWHAMRLEAGLDDGQLVDGWRTALTDFLVARIVAGTAAVWLAESREGVFGTTVVLMKDDFPFFLFRPGYYAFVGGVYTAPAWRGRGIATDLVRRAVQWARDHGASQVRLLPTEASRSIYLRLGFDAVEDLALPIQDPSAVRR